MLYDHWDVEDGSHDDGEDKRLNNVIIWAVVKIGVRNDASPEEIEEREENYTNNKDRNKVDNGLNAWIFDFLAHGFIVAWIDERRMVC